MKKSGVNQKLRIGKTYTKIYIRSYNQKNDSIFAT